MVIRRRIFTVLLAGILFGSLLFTLFLPRPRIAQEESESYSCLWEDGTVTQESYYGAFSALCGSAENDILLERAGKTGRVQASEEFLNAVEVFERGQLAELLSFTYEGNRLERAALWLRYGGRCYYSGDTFCWNGAQFSRTKRIKFEEVCLISGRLPNSVLRETGAETLIIYGESNFSASSLVGSSIVSVTAHAPYFVEGGAIYLKTVGGTRLIAALPNAEHLTISCDFLDEGALVACSGLKSLNLPQNYDGTLAMLFGETPMPEDLVIP